MRSDFVSNVSRLALHRFCPRCGAQPMELHPPHLTVCPACSLRLYHNASAATAAIVLDDHGQTLLIRRAHEPAQGRLAFAGGFLNNGETAEAGLRREVREETSLELGELTFLCSHPNTYVYGGVIYSTLDLFFIARVADFHDARALDEVADLVTLPVADVRGDELAFVSMQGAWRTFLSSRSRHA